MNDSMDPNISKNSTDTGEASQDVAPSTEQTAPDQDSPLSWDEARAALRDVMEKYMATPLPVVKAKTAAIPTTHKWWECLFRWDVDLYAGAAVSAALLGLSVASLATRKHGDGHTVLNASASVLIYRAQLAGSALLLAGSFFCIFLVKRRQYTFAHDSDVSKRRTIAKFLRATRDYNEADTNERNNGGESGRPKVEKEQLHHSGTSRTGIYPVFRRSEQQDVLWYSIPTLLLVRGDFIALQVGDVAPARCKLINPNSSTACFIEGGESITVESFGDLWGLSPSIKFSPGKTTIPADSRELLDLCNHMSVFVLDETPLESFLRLPNGKKRCIGGI